MRVLYVSNANAITGSNVALLHVVEQMMRLGHTVHVATDMSQGPLPQRLAAIGCPFTQIDMRPSVYPCNLNPLGYLPRIALMMLKNHRAKPQMEELIRQFAPHIVHTNVGPMPIAASICRRKGIPHVWHQREYLNLFPRLNFFPRRKSFLRQCQAPGNWNICITQGIFDYNHLRPDCDRVIYDGVFTEKTVADITPLPKERYVLFAGRVGQGKGTLDAIRVFAQFHHTHPTYRLLIAGAYRHDAYMAQCQQMVQRFGLTECVEFLGERTDIYTLMARAAMLVVPSHFEGFGFTTAEAMLCHCPVVGRDSAGTHEQFARGAAMMGGPIGFPYTTDAQMLQSMCQVADTHCAAIVERARQMVEAEYTVEHHVSQVIDFYHHILNSASHK